MFLKLTSIADDKHPVWVNFDLVENFKLDEGKGTCCWQARSFVFVTETPEEIASMLQLQAGAKAPMAQAPVSYSFTCCNCGVGQERQKPSDPSLGKGGWLCTVGSRWQNGERLQGCGFITYPAKH